MKRIPVFLFFSFLLLSDPLLDYANYLYSRGFCYEAVTEYKRFIFFNPEYPGKAKVFYRIGVCMRNEGSLDQALKYLKRAMALGYKKAIITTGVVLIAKRDYESAYVLLSYGVQFKEIKREAMFYMGISSLMMGDYDRAIDMFQLSFGDKGRELCLKIEELKHGKSPERASFLSRMLPGAGQLYSGSFKDFVGGLLTSGLALYFIGYHVAHEKFLEAIFVYVSLFQRYYQGGEKRAARIVQERELRKRRALALMALSLYSERPKNGSSKWVVHVEK